EELVRGDVEDLVAGGDALGGEETSQLADGGALRENDQVWLDLARLEEREDRGERGVPRHLVLAGLEGARRPAGDGEADDGRAPADDAGVLEQPGNTQDPLLGRDLARPGPRPERRGRDHGAPGLEAGGGH